MVAVFDYLTISEGKRLMSKLDKLLDRMRNNCNSNWQIPDLERVCDSVPGAELRAPNRGSHYTFSHPKLQDILTIPAKRPLKGFYVKRFVSMIDSIIEEEGTEGDGENPSHGTE
jgi:hypothetical protein